MILWMIINVVFIAIWFLLTLLAWRLGLKGMLKVRVPVLLIIGVWLVDIETDYQLSYLLLTGGFGDTPGPVTVVIGLVSLGVALVIGLFCS